MSDSSHYYTLDGKACHTQTCKPGAKNTTRPTTIADARKQGLFPSVSAITGVLGSSALVGYMQREVGKAAYKRPTIHPETEAEYVNYLVKQSKEDGSDAANLGTEVHAGLESYYGEPLLPQGEASVTLPSGDVVDRWELMEPAIKAIDGLNATIQESEKIVVNAPYGYAGTTDLTFTKGDAYGIIDFKTKRTKKGKKIVPYETQPMQIAAYLAGVWGLGHDYPIGAGASGYNIYISTTEVGRVEVVEYSNEDLLEAWGAFKNCLALYRYINKFDPRAT